MPAGMRPCVLYLTQENTVEETIERIWSHCFGNNSKIQDFDPQEAADMLKSVGLSEQDDPTKAEIIIKYRSTKTISVNDIRGMISELEKDGKKTVMIVQDYIKRLRPSQNIKDNTRLEYSVISDDLAALAKELNIPILTAMQFNRDGVREVESATTLMDQIASIERVGSSNISESIDIFQNADYCFSLGRATDMAINEAGSPEVKGKYLVVKLLAGRGKEPKVKSFKHRFIDGNDMRLDEDVDCPYSKSTFTKENMVNQSQASSEARTKGPRRILN